MSPVYQNSGPGLGEALVQAFAGYQGAKRQRQLVDEEHDDRIRRNTALDRADVRTRAMDAQSGLHILAPGELPPLAVAQAPGNEVAVPQINAPEIDFTHFLNQEMQTGPRAQPAPGAPSKAAAGALNIPGHPGARANAVQPSSDPGSNFQAMMAPALAQAGMPSRGPRFEFGQGYYLDRQPQWDAQDAAVRERNAARRCSRSRYRTRSQNANMHRDVRKVGLLGADRSPEGGRHRARDGSDSHAGGRLPRPSGTAPIHTAQADRDGTRDGADQATVGHRDARRATGCSTSLNPTKDMRIR
jgi:hypothetical protein